MLPTTQEPNAEPRKPLGKNSRWHEQLGARMLTIDGAEVAQFSNIAAKSLAATSS